MKKFLVTAALCISFLAYGQKTGLILSGGGAPGIAHIGVIKALEENQIPIDYITGTSIGAIIGGLYAIGMTPDEMKMFVKSADFRRWITGEIDGKNKFLYNHPEPEPTIFDIRFSVNKKTGIDFNTYLIPTNLIPSHETNYAFLPLCAQANALTNSNFDQLFVPFRCVASDVYKKIAVIFRSGDLGDAIRASATYPFLFKPIEVNNSLMFDGGIYNNFPADVMQNDFAPDYTIGSVVAYNPPLANRNDALMQIQNMIIHPTNYSLQSDNGLLLNLNLKAFSTFDFTKVDELVNIGYDSTIAHIKKIKEKVKRQVGTNELEEKRKTFKSKFPELKFKNIYIEGVDSIQRQYIEHSFRTENKTFGLTDFKEGYHKLISDDKITEVIPHAVYNNLNENFDLKLNLETQNQLKLMIGGYLSTRATNQAFLGLKYDTWDTHPQSTYFDFHVGQHYNGLQIGTRIENGSRDNFYLKLAFVLHQLEYYDSTDLLYSSVKTASVIQKEGYSKINLGFPLGMNGVVEIGVGYGALNDIYKQNRGLIYNYDTGSYSLGNLFCRAETNTLNSLNYPTKGFNYTASVQLIGGESSIKAENYPSLSSFRDKNLWLQFRAKSEQYTALSSDFSIGTYCEFMYSNRKLLSNYTADKVQSAVFQPTTFTRTIFNEALRANKFAAIGIKPIYNFSNQLHFRSEAYLFVPYQSTITAFDNNMVSSQYNISTVFLSETALVFNFKVATAAMFLNYCNKGSSNWNVGINLGILLFNRKFLE
ncbi:MAG: patatin-like phospholipase family protein [Paludibacter sp.]